MENSSRTTYLCATECVVTVTETNDGDGGRDGERENRISLAFKLIFSDLL